MNSSVLVSCQEVYFSYPDTKRQVLAGFSGELPTGVVSLVGPNGCGKSTLMLLAAGRLLPQQGTIKLLGRDTSLFVDETERNAFASFIYQNMEFETNEALLALLEQVYSGGFHSFKGETFFQETIEALELEKLGNRPLAKLSKGEMQRALLAFAALYGSRSIFMDEPVFAMEDRQKTKALEFFRSYHERTGISIYLSLHELELTRAFAQTALLFKADKTIELGQPADILTNPALEAAYGVPAAMLKHKEALDRRQLGEAADLLSDHVKKSRDNGKS